MKTYIGVVKWFDNKPKQEKKEGAPVRPNGCGFIFMSTEVIGEDDDEFVRDILIKGKTKCRIDYDEKLVEIFVHVSGVNDQIAKGDEVEFNLVEGQGAPKAVNVIRMRK